MKFTILVAAYNAKDYLERCLDSLLAQTEKSVQIICIDDHSTDDSLALQQKYTKEKGCILVIQTPENQGQAEARNLGLKYAVGELTMMVDADDWLAPDCLERIWEAYKEADDIDAVMMRLMMVEGKNVREWNNPAALPHVMTGKNACLLALRRQVHGLYAVRTEIHKKYPFDTTARLYSDDNTTYAHYLSSRKVVQSQGIYYYRQHATSMTHQMGLTRLMFLEANMSLRQLLENMDAGDDARSLCEDYCWKNFQSIYCRMQKYKRDNMLTADETEKIDTTLARAYEALKLERIGKRKWNYGIYRGVRRLVMR